MGQQMRALRARHARHESGFTLIELLVVVIILGVIAGVVVFAVRGTGDKGKAAAAAADIQTLRTAQEAYCAQFGDYANDDSELVNKNLLSEGATLHDVRQTTPGPCGGESFVVTCSPDELGCGTGGTVADPSLAGSITGIWTRAGDLPSNCAYADAGAGVTTTSPAQCTSTRTLDGSLVTMPNGQVLFFGENSTFGSSAPGSCAITTSAQPIIYRNNCGKPYTPFTAVYDPGTRAWTRTPPLPGLADTPAGYNPVKFGGMLLIKGTPAECGSNCGKVFVKANVVSNSTTSVNSLKAVNITSTSNPKFPNAVFYLYDPIAGTWALIPDPATTDPSFILSQDGLPPTQITGCSRTGANAGSDCGKVLMAGGTDSGAANRSAVSGFMAPGGTTDPNTTARTALFDPKAFDPSAAPPAYWSRTVGNYAFPSTDNIQYGTALPDGKVVAVAGAGGYSAVYDPLSKTWTPSATVISDYAYTCIAAAPGSASRRTSGFGAPVLRSDGRLIALATWNAGGCRENHTPTTITGTPTGEDPYSSLVFDPATLRWDPAPPDPSGPDYCPCGNVAPASVRLPALQGGGLLSFYANAIGGTTQQQSFLSPDGSGPFSVVNPGLAQNLNSDTTTSGTRTAAAVLPNGQVLVAGRTAASVVSSPRTAGGMETWLYTPPIPAP